MASVEIFVPADFNFTLLPKHLHHITINQSAMDSPTHPQHIHGYTPINVAFTCCKNLEQRPKKDVVTGVKKLTLKNENNVACRDEVGRVFYTASISDVMSFLNVRNGQWQSICRKCNMWQIDIPRGVTNHGPRHHGWGDRRKSSLSYCAIDGHRGSFHTNNGALCCRNNGVDWQRNREREREREWGRCERGEIREKLEAEIWRGEDDRGWGWKIPRKEEERGERKMREK